MGLRDFMMRKLMEKKLKDVPADEREKVLAIVEKNPEFFQKVALEVQEEMKKGKSQINATMEVMQRHKDELQGLM